MIRLATGHAKLRLANEVTVDDVEVTRKLLLESRSMEAKQNLMQEGKDDDDLDLADDDLMDVDEEGSAAPKPKRQKKTADEEIDQAVMGTIQSHFYECVVFASRNPLADSSTEDEELLNKLFSKIFTLPQAPSSRRSSHCLRN